METKRQNKAKPPYGGGLVAGKGVRVAQDNGSTGGEFKQLRKLTRAGKEGWSYLKRAIGSTYSQAFLKPSIYRIGNQNVKFVEE